VAAREAAPQRYPVKTRRLQRGRRANALLWLCHRDAVLLQQRPDTGVWAGLWSLPAFDEPATLQALSAAWPGHGDWLPTIEHALTHFDWTLQPLRWTLPARTPAARLQAVVATLPALDPPARWWPLQQALALGLPAPVRRLLQAG
jgi:A/G-specific adenine glycosylase